MKKKELEQRLMLYEEIVDALIELCNVQICWDDAASTKRIKIDLAFLDLCDEHGLEYPNPDVSEEQEQVLKYATMYRELDKKVDQLIKKLD